MTRFLVPLFLIITIFTGCGQRKETESLFPLLDAIYSYDASGPTLKVSLYSEAPYKLSKDFFRYSGNYLFAAPESGNVLSFDPIKKEYSVLLHSDFSKFFVVDDTLFTLSRINYEGKGFLLETYRIAGDPPRIAATNDCGIYLDLFCTDYAVFGGDLYLAGSDSKDLTNSVIRVDPSDGNTVILSSLKNRDFLKFSVGGEVLFVYASVAAPTNRSTSYWTIPVSGGPVERIDLETPLPFIGSGVVSGGSLFAPAYLDNFSIAIYKIKNGTVAPFAGTVTGVYKVLSITNGEAVFVGFNYYLDSDSFELVSLDLSKPQNFRRAAIRR
jgi:hypothetical protein